MTLEEFTIENWTCIRRLAVHQLPPQGVVLLHGPNRTGKSSIVAALRAALFEFKPTSTDSDLKKYFPNWTSEPPRVTISFRLGNQRYRCCKQFHKSGESTLEEATPGGGWNLITRTPKEVHERTLALIGGFSKNNPGLTQLLWLNQADFDLPSEKEFDPNLKTRLGQILGSMQTPADDAFRSKLLARWKVWFSGGVPGPNARRSKSSELAKHLAALQEARTRLEGLEAKAREHQQQLERADYLKLTVQRLEHKLAQQEAEVERLKQINQQVAQRAHALALAEERWGKAKQALAALRERHAQRLAAQRQVTEAKAALELARGAAAQADLAAAAGQQALQTAQAAIETLREQQRTLGRQQANLQHLLRMRELERQLEEATRTAKHVQEIALQVNELDRQDREQPAPTAAELDQWEALQAEAVRLRLHLQAAAMSLRLEPLPNCTASLSADDAPERPILQPEECRVRRRADIVIPAWGRIRISRGQELGRLDQDEQRLAELEGRLRDCLAEFGFTVTDEEQWKHLRRRVVEHEARQKQRQQLIKEQERLGVRNVAEFESRCQKLRDKLEVLRAERTEPAERTNPAEQADGAVRTVPSEQTDRAEGAERGVEDHHIDVEKQAAEVRSQQEAIERQLAEAEQLVRGAEGRLFREPDGLIHRQNQARHELAAAEARLDMAEEHWARQPAAEELEQALATAEEHAHAAQRELEAAQLTANEQAIAEQFQQSQAELERLRGEREQLREELHRLEGLLAAAAGLHQHLAEAQAAVQMLEDLTQREELTAQALNRLFELFEECRERQVAAVIQPVTARVLRWMRMAGIGDYDVLEFNEHYLPQALAAAQGRTLPLERESAGAREAIGLMVRLALGTVLVPPGQPAVAVLDDPLTHCDPVRMDRMRAVLRTAAAGDPQAIPPAGPLQILIFSCHPERFQLESCKTIDLGDPAVLQRV